MVHMNMVMAEKNMPAEIGLVAYESFSAALRHEYLSLLDAHEFIARHRQSSWTEHSLKGRNCCIRDSAVLGALGAPSYFMLWSSQIC